MKRIALLAAASAFLMSSVPAMAQQIVQNKTKSFTARDTTIVVTYDFLNYGNGQGNKISIVKKVEVTQGPSVGIVAAASDLKPSGFQPLVGAEATNLTVTIDRVNGNNTGNYETDTQFYTQITGISLN